MHAYDEDELMCMCVCVCVCSLYALVVEGIKMFTKLSNILIHREQQIASGLIYFLFRCMVKLLPLT